MANFFDILGYTANITLPIFVVVFLGWYLRRTQVISTEFIATSSRLVFNLALPALLFTNILATDLQQLFNSAQVLYALLATLGGFILVWFHGRKWRAQPRIRGVFVQSAFRGNMGIIGLALCASLYGEQGLAVGSILLAFLTLAYNVLSVYALTAPFYSAGLHPAGAASHRWFAVVRDIGRNPLIIAILAALLLQWLQWRIPQILLTSGNYFAQLTLPLALLCVGGSINLAALRHSTGPSIWACSYKLLLLPVPMTVGAWALGFEGVVLGTLFAMFASPTATASFVMAKAMGGDADLAANTIALTTVLSLFTLSTGIFVLTMLNIG